MLPPEPTSAPDSIGPYRILEVLGEGGMGIVYLAEQKEPIHRRVALKLIKVGLDSKQVLARFEAERQALALMAHPGIARVLDAGHTAEGRPYFVMDLVLGEPITVYCDRLRLRPHERLALFLDVCDAVQHAHQRGILHRDLKPSNVLVEIVDGTPRVKVIDFGLAKALHQRLTERTLFTERGMLAGTPEYMSPEQADPSALDIDTSTDVYSLGVLLYELLTGVLPIDPKALRKAGWEGMMRLLREAEPAKPSTRLSSIGTAEEVAARRHSAVRELRRELRGDLDWITLKALEKERRRRYQTAAEFADDLRRHAASLPVKAGPPSALYRGRKFVRRHRIAVTTTAAVAAALIAGLIGTSIMYSRAEAARRHLRQGALRLHRAEGLKLATEKDRAGGLVWLARALEFAEDPADEKELRIGIGMLLKEAPRLKSLWVNPARLRAVSWSPTGAAVLEQNRAGHCTVRGVDGRRILGPVDCSATSEFVAPWLPDGNRVALANVDGSVTIWNVRSGAAELGPLSHGGQIASLGFDRAGSRLLVASTDGHMSLWDLSVAPRRLCRVPPRGQLLNAAISPTGERFFAGMQSEGVYLYSGHDCRLIRAITSPGAGTEQTEPMPATFSPDGSILSTSVEMSARIWNAHTGAPISPELFSPDSETPYGNYDVAISADNRLLATANSNNAVDIWETTSGRRFGGRLGHNNGGHRVAFSPNTDYLASATFEGTVRLWKLGTNAHLVHRFGGGSSVVGLEFDPDGRNLLVAESSGIVRIWDLAGGLAAARRVAHLDLRGLQVQFSADGSRLLYAQGTSPGLFGPPHGRQVSFAQILDPRTGERLSPPLRHTTWVKAAFAHGDQNVLTAEWEGRRIRSWNALGNAHSIDVTSNSPIALLWRLQSVGMGAVVGALKGELLFLDMARGIVERAEVDDLEMQFGPSLSPDGSRIASPGVDGTLVVSEWGAGGKVLLRLKFDSPLYQPLWSPLGDKLAVGEESGFLHLVDLASGEAVDFSPAHGAWVQPIEFRKGGRELLTVSADGGACLWDTKTRRRLLPALQHPGLVYFARSNRDDTLWFTGSMDGHARFWSPRTGEQISSPLDDGASQFDGAFSPVDDLFATAGIAGLRIREISPVQLSPGGLRDLAGILSGRQLEGIVLSMLEPGALRAIAESPAGEAALAEQAAGPEDIAAWLARDADSLLAAGRLPEAVRRLEQRLALGPHDRLDARLELADALARHGELESAARQLRLVAETNDNYPEATFGAGLIELSRDEMADFEQVRDTLLSRHSASTNPDRAYFGARLLVLKPLGSSPARQAVEWAKLAVSAWPGDREALALLAIAQARAGHLDEARVTLRSAAAIPDSQPGLQEHLYVATVEAAAGQSAASGAALHKAALAVAALPSSDWQGRLEYAVLKAQVDSDRTGRSPTLTLSRE